MKKFEKFCSYFVLFVFGIIMTYMTYVSFVTTAYMYDWEDTLFIDDNIILNIVGILLTVLLAFLAYRKKITISDKFVKIYVIVVNVILVWFVLSTQFVPVDDQGQVISAASAFLKGNYEPWNEGGYCFRWGHQNGVVLMYSLFSLIFGEGNGTAFQLLNVLFIWVTFYYIHKSFKKLFPEEKYTNLILIGLYTYLPYLLYTTYVYGTLIGMMFVTAGFYYGICFLEDTGLKHGILAGILLALATACKSNFYIYIIALGIVYLLDVLKDGKAGFKSKGSRKILFLCMVVLMCVLIRITTTAIIEKNIGKDAPQGAPTILFVVMGIQEGWKAPGWCNSFDDIMYTQAGYDQAEANRLGILWFKNEAAKFYHNPDYMVRFFNEKVASIWANPTFECFEIQKSRPANSGGVPGLIAAALDIGSPFNGFLTELMDVIQTILYFGVLLFIILNFKKIAFRKLLFGLTFVGVFLFHVIWEARCHYTVAIISYLIPYGVLGYVSVAEKLSWAIENRNEITKKKILRLSNIIIAVLLIAVVVVTALMENYSIIPEKEAYENFVSGYTYESRMDLENVSVKSFMNEDMVLTIAPNEDGNITCLENYNETKNQKFSFGYNFSDSAVNYYFIWNEENDRILYLRDETWINDGKVYTHNYDFNRKNLWRIQPAGDDSYYIVNYYGKALGYNIYTNEVLLIPFNGEDNQKWKFGEIAE